MCEPFSRVFDFCKMCSRLVVICFQLVTHLNCVVRFWLNTNYPRDWLTVVMTFVRRFNAILYSVVSTLSYHVSLLSSEGFGV